MVIGLVSVGVDRERCRFYVTGFIEQEHALGALPVNLHDLDAEVAPALLALLVAQDYRLSGREVPVTLIVLPGFKRNLRSHFLSVVAVCKRDGRDAEAREERKSTGET